MAMVIGVLALMVATADLVVGLLVHAEVTALTAQAVNARMPNERSDKHRAGRHPTHSELTAMRGESAPPMRTRGASGTPPPTQYNAGGAEPQSMTYEQRVDQAVTQKQYDNFMTYDGGEQDPIDRTTILADSGE